jgi:histidine triad (HIT) family protein
MPDRFQVLGRLAKQEKTVYTGSLRSGLSRGGGSRLGPHGNSRTTHEETSMENCIFCKIVSGAIPCFKVYEDERVLAFEDINPITPGHTLVVPKRHSVNLFDISEEDLWAVAMAARKIAGAMKKGLASDGVVSMQLSGRAVHQEVMHYHLHLVPRREEDPPLPLANWEIKPGNMDAIKVLAGKIIDALKE